MARFVVEKCFMDVFAALSMYFYIDNRNIGSSHLIHQPTSYYVLDLVEEFYDVFAKSDILDDCKSFKLMMRLNNHHVCRDHLYLY